MTAAYDIFLPQGRWDEAVMSSAREAASTKAKQLLIALARQGGFQLEIPSWETFGPLVRETFFAIFEVFILCAAGFLLARRGTLDNATTKKLSKVNVNLFTPALIFSKVAASLTKDKLQELAIVPVLFIIITSFSALVGLFTAKVIFRLPKTKTGFVMACAMFQNSNSLPVALIQSLIITVPQLKWGSRDSRDQMLARGLTYLMLYSVFGMILRWSYGVRLLAASGADPEDDENEAEISTPEVADLVNERESAKPQTQHESGYSGTGDLQTARKLSDSATQVPRILKRSPTDHTGANFDTALSNVTVEDFLSKTPKDNLARLKPLRQASDTAAIRRRLRQSGMQSFPSSPVQSRPASVTAEEIESDDEELVVGSATMRGRLRRMWKKMKPFRRASNKYLGKPLSGIINFMTPPLWASLASLFVALVPGCQKAYLVATPIKNAINNAGNCSIPITLVVLGAYFVSTPPPAETKPTLNGSNGLQSEPESIGELTDPDRAHVSQFDIERSPGQYDSSAKPTRHSWYRSLRTRLEMTEDSKTILAAILSRMIFAPLILYPLFAWYCIVTVENVADDPVFILAAVLLIGGPSAITLAQITQAASPSFELLISRVMFHSYAVATPPLTILGVVVGLIIAGSD